MLSFAVTAYRETTRNNCGWIKECIGPAVAHPAFREIVIVDDCSDDFDELAKAVHDIPKVCLYRNSENYGVFGNKLEAVARCTGEWVVNLDSDNTCTTEYLDQVAAMKKDPYSWYCPSYAQPVFDYRPFIGQYDIHTIKAIFGRPLSECMMNTGNEIVHRESFVEAFGQYRGKRFDLMMPNLLEVGESDRHSLWHRLVWDALDSFVFNLEWLKAGGRLVVVDGLEYGHRTKEGLGNYDRSPKEKDDLGRLLMKELIAKAKE